MASPPFLFDRRYERSEVGKAADMSTKLPLIEHETEHGTDPVSDDLPAANLRAADFTPSGAIAESVVPSEAPPANTRGKKFGRATKARRIGRMLGIGLVNLWLIYHLAAIVIAPWSVPPSSRLIQKSWRLVGAYDQALYLNHGYHYFAPEPGPSTLVAYVREMPDGHVETGRIPNRGIWPRLLYHRHFMLTETLASGDALAPAVKTELIRAMARQVGKKQGARRVTLSLVTHRLPSMEFIRAGGTLDDSHGYSEEPLGTFACDEL